MKKIKYLLNRLCFVGAALFGIWGCSFLPTTLLSEMGKVFWVLSGFVLAVFCVLCLKRYKKTAMTLVVCFLCGSAQAQFEDRCAVVMQSSVEEGNWCLYEGMIQKFGSQTCSFMKSFNPTKVRKRQRDREEMMERIANADGILDAYNALDEGRKNALALNCQRLTPEETELPVQKKVDKLKNATHPVCCAENLQSLYQIYNSQFSSRDIETLPTMLMDEKNQCWVCDVVYILINLANTMAYRAAPQMAVVGLFFLKWAFVFWLVLKIGMLFMNRNINGKPYSGGTFFQELLIRLLCVGLAAIVITDTAQKVNDSPTSAVTDVEKGTMLDEAYSKLLNPPLELIAEVGINISDNLRKGEGTFFGMVAERVKQSPNYGFDLNTSDYCKTSFDIKRSSLQQKLTSPTSKAKEVMDGIYTGRVIGEDLTKKMLCLTQQAFRGVSPLATLGSLFLTDGIKNGESLPLGMGRLPKLAQCIYGLVMMLCCWSLGISVAFRLIDITIRLSIFILLAPILIALAVFPITRDKAKAGVRFMVSAIMGFIEISIGVALVIPFFMGAIARTEAQKEALLDAMVAPSSSKYVSNLYDIFSSGGFITFVLVSSICWMGKFLLDASQKFFNHIFGTQNVGQMGGASMAGVAADMRGAIGGVADWTKTDRAKMIGAAAKNTKVGRGMTKMQQGIKNSAAGAKRYVQGKASQASNYVKNSKVGRAASAAKNGVKNVGQKVANSKVGQAAKTLANSKVGRFAKGTGKVAGGVLKGVGSMGKEMLQRSGKFVKDQAKKGVHDFFHPKE